MCPEMACEARSSGARPRVWTLISFPPHGAQGGEIPQSGRLVFVGTLAQVNGSHEIGFNSVFASMRRVNEHRLRWGMVKRRRIRSTRPQSVPEG